MQESKFISGTVSGNDFPLYDFGTFDGAVVSGGDISPPAPGEGTFYPNVNFVSQESGWTEDTVSQYMEVALRFDSGFDTLLTEVQEINIKLTLIVAVVAIFIVWKIITVTNKIFSWLF